MEDQQLRDLFSKKLANAEAPVDPALWGKISSASAVAGAGAAGAGTSAILGWVGVAVAAVAITSAAIFFTSDSSRPTAEKPQPTEEQVSLGVTEDVEVAVDDREPEVPKHSSAEENPVQTKRSTERIVGDDPAADTILLETVQQIQNQASEDIAEEEGSLMESEEEIVQNDQEEASTEQQQIGELKADEGLTARFSFYTDPYDELTIRFSPEFQEGAQYIWLFGDGSTSKQRAPEHSYEEEGSYDVMLTVVDINGFTKQINITVDAYLPAQIVLPNVFTPNSDGRNDYLTIGEDSRKVNIERILVYDSNGTLVFEQLGEGPGWDGTDRSGNACVQGNYRLIVVATSNAGQQFNESQMVRLQR